MPHHGGSGQAKPGHAGLETFAFDGVHTYQGAVSVGSTHRAPVWFAGCPQAPSQTLSWDVWLPRASRRCMRCLCAHSLLPGSGVACNTGRTSRLTRPLDPLAAFCMIFAPLLPPANAPAPYGLSGGWEWQRRDERPGGLWDAHAAPVLACGCCPPPMLVLR
eukprot:172492-Chlamydomonas_euryale.AAC.6